MLMLIDFYQEYNYAADYDKGDEDFDADELFERIDNEYWEPGEDEFMNGHKEEVALELFKTVFGKDFDPVEIMNEAMRKPKPKKKQKRYFDEDDSDDEDDDDDYSEQPQSLEEFKASVEAHMEEWLANNEQAQRGKDLPPLQS